MRVSSIGFFEGPALLNALGGRVRFGPLADLCGATTDVR